MNDNIVESYCRYEYTHRAGDVLYTVRTLFSIADDGIRVVAYRNGELVREWRTNRTDVERVGAVAAQWVRAEAVPLGERIAQGMVVPESMRP